MRRIGVFRSDGRKRRTASCIHSVSLSFIMNDCQDLQTSRHKRSSGVWTGCSQDARFGSVLHAAEIGVSHVFAASFLRFLCPGFTIPDTLGILRRLESSTADQSAPNLPLGDITSVYHHRREPNRLRRADWAHPRKTQHLAEEDG